jgi:hypothetical protein
VRRPSTQAAAAAVFTRIITYQIFVPVAFDLEVAHGAELDRFDQVVREIGIDVGLPELLERRSAANQPGLQVPLWRGHELAGLLHVVAVAADEFRMVSRFACDCTISTVSPTLAVSALLPVSAPSLPLNAHVSA